MKHTVFYLALSFLIIGCKDVKKTNTEDSTKTLETTYEDNSKIGRTNYAVVWNWTTTDVKLVTDNANQINEDLSNLWKKDVVENVYYDSDAQVDKLGHHPNVSFFIKAHSEQEARTVLNSLTLITKGLANYTLFPVGNLWLDRKFKTIHEKGMTKSYVAVWTTTGKPSSEITKAQSDKVLALWNEGSIENVYFDIEGTQTANDKTDFVFYVNKNTEAEAKEICNSLPIYKEKMASYKLYPVGVFWMGKYEQE